VLNCNNRDGATSHIGLCSIKAIVLAPSSVKYAFMLPPHAASVFAFFRTFVCSLLLPCMFKSTALGLGFKTLCKTRSLECCVGGKCSGSTHAFEPFPCTHPTTPSTRVSRSQSQVPFFNSSVWNNRESKLLPDTVGRIQATVPLNRSKKTFVVKFLFQWNFKGLFVDGNCTKMEILWARCLAYKK